ncbi:MAG: hypothetical protein IAF02_11580 [Anaerolineae bacterium]|nr:hypothetical protein [Anaerolineae bacterium]
MADRNELLQRQQALQDVYEEASTQLMEIPGVIGVGIGIKEKSGDLTEDIAFRVYVVEKKSLEDIPTEERIPETIMGFMTDVIKVYQPKLRVFVERMDTKDHRPLKGGVAIGAENVSGQGTLGWFGIRNSDSARILLTNKHVIFSDATGTSTETKKVGQASYSSFCCCECGEIGETIVGIINNNVDCAIARLDDDVNLSLILTNNATTQQISIAGSDAAIVGETVRKIGMRSGFTTGVVIDIGAVTVTPPNDPAGTPVSIIPNQILIRPDATETYEIENGKFAFSNYGDSGSVIVNGDNEIVGLLYSGDENNYSVDITFANNIANVLTALSNSGNAITLSVSPPGGRSYVASRHAIPKTPQPLTRTRLDDILARTLDGDPAANPLVQAIQDNSDEIISLINHSRPVTVTWHRKQGPSFAGAFMRSVKEPSYQIPDEINGISRQLFLNSMAAALEEYGSDRLKEAIQSYSLPVIYACIHNDSVEDIVAALHHILMPSMETAVFP